MAEKNILGKILFTQEDITRRAKEIAAQIDRDYEGEEVILLGTLKGSILWLADILKYTNVDTKIDFITASSYGSSTSSSGVVKITYEPRINMYNKHVLVIEDIIDTGRTLNDVVKMLKARNPLSLRVVTLLDKPSRRIVDFNADISLFTIPDYFVIGYGLDCGELYRNLPYIAEYDLSK
jgi:hypoxanthine phosphoribosyltransferase